MLTFPPIFSVILPVLTVKLLKTKAVQFTQEFFSAVHFLIIIVVVVVIVCASFVLTFDRQVFQTLYYYSKSLFAILLNWWNSEWLHWCSNILTHFCLNLKDTTPKLNLFLIDSMTLVHYVFTDLTSWVVCHIVVLCYLGIRVHFDPLLQNCTIQKRWFG